MFFIIDRSYYPAHRGEFLAEPLRHQAGLRLKSVEINIIRVDLADTFVINSCLRQRFATRKQDSEQETYLYKSRLIHNPTSSLSCKAKITHLNNLEPISKPIRCKLLYKRGLELRLYSIR